MQYFREKDLAYVYPGSRQNDRVRKILGFSTLLSVLSMAGVSLYLRVAVPETGREYDPILALFPLITIPFLIASMLFVRNRIAGAGSVRVDPMSGTLSLGSGSAGLFGRRELSCDSIRSLRLSGTGSGIPGTPSVGLPLWVVVVVTTEGTIPLLTFRDRTEAVGMAAELSGLLSVPFDDRQDGPRDPGDGNPTA